MRGNNFIMNIRSVYLISNLLVPVSLHATPGYEPPSEIVVEAVGIAVSPDAAKRALVMDAVSRATTTYAMSKNTITNDQLDAKIATFSEGVVKGMTGLSVPAKGGDGMYRITGTVTVVRKNLIDSLRRENIPVSSSVRSDDLFARAVSVEALQKNSNEIFGMLLDEDPRRFTAKIIGDVTPVNAKLLTLAEVDAGGINWMTATVKITANIAAYRDEFQSRLEKVLDSVTGAGERMKEDFDKYAFPEGFVFPAADVTELSGGPSAFTQVQYAGRMIDLSPPYGAEHIYRRLFIPDNTVFSAGKNPPLNGAGVSWAFSTKTRPFTGFNVMLMGVDHNGYPTMRGYAVAPAFFQTFQKLLAKHEHEARRNPGALVVILQLVGKNEGTVKKFEYPLPRGGWFDKAAYAGTPESSPANQRIALMPVGLSPHYVDSMMIQQKRLGAGVLKTQKIVSMFSTISSAVVTFKFPLKSEDLANVREIRVKTLVDD